MYDLSHVLLTIGVYGNISYLEYVVYSISYINIESLVRLHIPFKNYKLIMKYF